MARGSNGSMTFAGVASLIVVVICLASSSRLAAMEASYPVPSSGEGLVPAIRYGVLRSGPQGGRHPTRNSLVELRYTGRFPDGTEFGTSLGNKPDGTTIFPQYMLIPGCQSVLMLMRPGDRWRVTIPPEQAYGLTGHSLAGKTLVFDLELVAFVDEPAVPLPAYTRLPKP